MAEEDSVVLDKPKTPLIMTITIDRATGSVSFLHNVEADRIEDDLRLLHQTIQTLSNQLMEDRLNLYKSNKGLEDE